MMAFGGLVGASTWEGSDETEHIRYAIQDQLA
jgi:hypothetical protein